jgi:hypothetical protein
VWDWQDRGRVEPLMIQVVGAGGTGKTTLLGVMRRHLPDGFMTVAAFTGVAATLVGFGARTLNSLMRFGVPKGTSRAFLNKPISTKQRAALQAIFSKSHLLVVDEVSMLSPDMLSAIDKRLRAALDRDRPFGGVGILLCGDYLQIPPVGATTLPAVMTSTNPRSEHVSARALFADFVTYHLHTQHRFSADPAWGADMSALRAMVRNPVSPALLSSLQVLTTETFREDPVFADPAQTRILVLNNYMRCRINLERAKDFATATGRVVLGWRRPFTKAVRTALREPGPRAAAGRSPPCPVCVTTRRPISWRAPPAWCLTTSGRREGSRTAPRARTTPSACTPRMKGTYVPSWRLARPRAPSSGSPIHPSASTCTSTPTPWTAPRPVRPSSLRARPYGPSACSRRVPTTPSSSPCPLSPTPPWMLWRPATPP